MDLKPVNVKSFKGMSATEKSETAAKYEAEKVQLIQEYMRLQDLVDQYNEDIYQLTCKIEQINLILQELRHVPHVTHIAEK